MIISVPKADLFRHPSYDSEHTDEVMFGTDVEITDKIEPFIKITTDYGYTGWTDQKNAAEKLAPANKVVIAKWADLLKSAENYYPPVMTLPMGSLVDAGYSPEFKKHAFVILPDKRIFYIRKEALGEIPRLLPEDEARRTICDTAKTFYQTQYRWGGRTHMGIDCSGLAFTAYRAAGITIWRDAQIDKTKILKKITLEEAKRGDLLFFEGHMAIYLEDNDFIHAAAAPGQVEIASLDLKKSNYSDWCAKHLINAGTVF